MFWEIFLSFFIRLSRLLLNFGIMRADILSHLRMDEKKKRNWYNTEEILGLPPIIVTIVTITVLCLENTFSVWCQH